MSKHAPSNGALFCPRCGADGVGKISCHEVPGPELRYTDEDELGALVRHQYYLPTSFRCECRNCGSRFLLEGEGEDE